MHYILSIDQSTSCTKALLIDEKGLLCGIEKKEHQQIINAKGWVEHNMLEIYQNCLEVVSNVIKNNNINKKDIVSMGISNQRETTIAWNKDTGYPLGNAIVWQCGRANKICNNLVEYSSKIKELSGMNLSPYFSAGKMAWILENIPEAKILQRKNKLILSTVDCWLIYNLSGKKEIKTDYSNASRTQLFNIKSLKWDDELEDIFGIDKYTLPQVCDSDSLFCMTNIEGILPKKIPVYATLGDSNASLFAHGCISPGMIKTTYGTGSSIMLNTGNEIVTTKNLVSSLAWKLNKEITYVLEGNVNYSCSVTKWLKDDLQIIQNLNEAGIIAQNTIIPEGFYFVPAFSGFGAPYWEQDARTLICGMDRTVGKNEIIRATEEAIDYQINDVISFMKSKSKFVFKNLHVDGGASRDKFLMQFESDISGLTVKTSRIKELSGVGCGLISGIKFGLFDKKYAMSINKTKNYYPKIDDVYRAKKLDGWAKAVKLSINYIY